MTPQEAHKILKDQLGILIDVREDHELQETGIAEGALWMPTSKMQDDNPEWQQFKKNLPKDKKILLYCRSGVRSGRVAEFLAQEGYTTYNIGGFNDWQAAQLPTKKFS